MYRNKSKIGILTWHKADIRVKYNKYVNLYGGIDMDTMQGLKRTHYCGDVEGIGNEVVMYKK